MIHLRRLLIGCGLLLLGTLPVGGPFLFFMVVSSFGFAALIPIPPFAYLVGLAFEKMTKKSHIEKLEKSNLATDQKALVNNIWELKKRNMTNTQIDAELKSLGWTDENIKEAFALYEEVL